MASDRPVAPRRAVRVRFEPDDRVVEVAPGTTLAEALREAGLLLDQPCGGRGRCGKCAVLLREPGGSRRVLACRHRLEADAVVEELESALPADVAGLSESPACPYDLGPAARPSAADRALLGAAVDIGTTTVVVYLYDLVSVRRLAVTSGPNRQAAYGADVVSRIAAATRDGGRGLDRLRRAVHETVAGLLARACAEARVSAADVRELVAVGNTAMHHLFLGLDPTCLGRAPFRPACRGMVSVPAASFPELGLDPHGHVVFLPVIAGYLGADTTAVILATGQHLAARNRLIIDIGTNGEIVLGGRDGLWACSAAAGPALEGAGLSCGMRAGPGAVDEVRLEEGRVHVTTIGGGSPRGLCGSGVVSAVAELLRAGLLTPAGRLRTAARPEGGPDLLAGASGSPEAASEGVVLVPAEESATGRPIVLTQADVRAVQLAKAAIAAGIEVLLTTTGVPKESVSEVLLAGAFGNYLDIADAKTIGLLPDLPGVPVRPVGNAAGAGAQLALLSAEARAEAERIAARVTHVELGGRPEFEAAFIRHLALTGWA